MAEKKSLGERLEESIFGFDPFELHSFVDWMGGWGVSRALVLWVLFTGFLALLSLEIPDLPLFGLEWLLGTAPVWLPIGLVVGAFHLWVEFAQERYTSGREGVLLEIKMPRDIYKSPRAMEVALNNFWISTGEVTFLVRFFRGQVRPWFSLEMASFGGDVHFYFWTWRSYKNVVESAIYGQYPEVEIYEVEDYASAFRFDPERYTCFATDYAYDGRSDAFPIKSYIDFELDKDPKEENKVEPMGQIVEVLSSIRKTEQVWIQIMFRQAGKHGGVLAPKNSEKEWRSLVSREVDRLRAQASVVSSTALDEVYAELGEDRDRPGRTPQARASWRQTRQMETLERHLGKLPYEAVARGVYIADTTKGPFDGATYSAVRWIWRPYNNPGYLNVLRPKRWHNPFDYPWQDFRDLRWNLMSRRFFDAYRRRSSFYPPWLTPVNIMTTETIATLWHPPSRAVAAPGLERIPSVKAPPPSNLPM